MENNNKSRGFTLLELMITLSIAIMLITIGLPSFTNLIRDSRMTANANDILTALNYARSEAVTRNVQVTILKQGGASKVWDGGWQIFTDLDRDGVLDLDDTLLKVHEAISANYTLRTGGTFANWVAYLPDGLSVGSGSSLGNDSFKLCDTSEDKASSRKILVNRVGRARVEAGTVNSADCT
ncbi:MAG: GspH/FimT family pseudopilin [Gammaproteobacteria bacterium]|nr:GspH/FimT family pseudopilin [Gammaproteobacteria bacterium]